jgi:hypothetical protein
VKKETKEDVRRNRSRWLAASGVVALLWCSGWYCRGDDFGLLIAAALLGCVAIMLPRGLTSNSRWIIWTWLLITVVCLSSNVTRLVQPEDTLGDGYVMDRVVTAAYALGVLGLFFNWGRLSFTVIVIGAIPMLMRVLGRVEGQPGGLEGGEGTLMVWGFVALMTAYDLVRQTTDRRAVGQQPMLRVEVAARSAWLVVMLVLAAGLFVPVKWLAFEAQRQVFGLASNLGQNSNHRRSTDLFLGQQLPEGFQKRERVVLLIQAENAPDYLRENVYTTYQGGRWKQTPPGDPMIPINEALTEKGDDQVYALVDHAESTTSGS